MTAALTNIQNIDTLYPQPGVDNNSQGFRDNFNNIQTALTALDTYMNGLAVTTLNVVASAITGTQVVAALNTLQLGSSTYITTGQMFDTVVKGLNFSGTDAVGSVAFFPNVIPITVQNISHATSSFNAYNTTTGILIGATFSCNNPTPSGPYTVTGTNGYTIFTSPVPAFNDTVVNITNPIFKNFTVINASTISNILAEVFSQDLAISSGNDSSDYTNGALTVVGGVGISKTLNVNGFLNSNGNLSVAGNIISTSSVIFNGLTIAGDLTLKDKYNDPSPSLTLNIASFINSFSASAVDGNQPMNGYQVFPGGMIMMWGTTENVQGDGSYTVTFPQLQGQSSAGFPNNCLHVELTAWNNIDNLAQDLFAEIVSVSNTQLRVILQGSYKWQGSGNPVNWFAIGN